ncbi:hypothetical protein [Paraferrimonas haliotis]|uniref:Uncharacterized protein n=1 Tax=Paraferrimonas haliotis TaxID=2013866 RepID=A0AA37WX40_9GAMM|nr:hypothetical protein [Paraferrimonas haliotis]GLS82999.1 hypothetical protein GCM10007894_09760 [Paraferrimonas haliotis]
MTLLISAIALLAIALHYCAAGNPSSLTWLNRVAGLTVFCGVVELALNYNVLI